MCFTGQTRLLLGDREQYITNTLPDVLKSIEEFFIYNSTLLAGRVEYCANNGIYYNLCGDLWTNVEAAIVCKTLGLSPYGMPNFIHIYMYIVTLDSTYVSLTILLTHRCSGSYKWCLSPAKLSLSSP